VECAPAGGQFERKDLARPSLTERSSADKIEIRLPDGTAITVGQDVGLVALRGVVTALRR
jgi:hypothetical protein